VGRTEPGGGVDETMRVRLGVEIEGRDGAAGRE
jgi:hypothetical protein